MHAHCFFWVFLFLFLLCLVQSGANSKTTGSHISRASDATKTQLHNRSLQEVASDGSYGWTSQNESSVLSVANSGDNLLASYGKRNSMSETYIAVGAPSYGSIISSLGAVYIYSKNSDGTWNTNTHFQIIQETNADYANFGWGVSITESYLLVGAPVDPTLVDPTQVASASMYQSFDGEQFSHVVTWTNPSSSAVKFGFSVSMIDSSAIVGAPGPKGVVSMAYIYGPTAEDSWGGISSASVILTDPTGSDYTADGSTQFGSCVSMSYEYIIVGAYNTTNGGLITGAAYIYGKTNGQWSDSRLLSMYGPQSSAFGYSVSITNDYAIVGAPLYSESSNQIGAVYIYGVVDGVWSSTPLLQVIADQSAPVLGLSVSLSTNFAVVGAYSEDNYAPVAYIYGQNDDGIWISSPIATLDINARVNATATSASITESYAIISLFNLNLNPNSPESRLRILHDIDDNYNNGGVVIYNRCQPGSYSTSNVCEACAVGKYGTDGSSCSACEPGKFTNIVGSTVCTGCSPGTYSSSGANICADCEPGKFTSSSQSSSCSSCGDGTYTASLGSSECSSCSPGTYANIQGATACTPCSTGLYCDYTGCISCTSCLTGYYNEAVGATVCTACAAGKYSGTEGASVCSLCPAGKYSGTEGASVCSSCPAGKYNGTEGASVCSSCPAGKSSSTEGASVCSSCPAGSFSNTTGNAACTSCAVGHYSNIGTTVCTPCSVGKYAASQGTASCSLCPAGHYSDVIGAVSCKGCARGNYTQTMGNTVCLACPSGKQTSFIGSTQCYSCLAGNYTSGTVCTYCPNNTYSDRDGATRCSACPSGKFTNGTIGNSKCAHFCGTGMSTGSLTVDASSQCSLCRAGTIWTSASASSSTNASMVGPTCQDCREGYYNLEQGATTCTECPPGYQCNSIGMSNALACPRGTYTSREGSVTCEACPLGEITPTIGTTTALDCVSPVYNFYLGFIAIIAVVIIAYPYLFRGRFERLAFFRRVRVGDNLVDEAWSVFPKLHEFYVYSKAKTQKQLNASASHSSTPPETETDDQQEVSINQGWVTLRRFGRILLFAILSLVLISMGVVVYFVVILLSVLFKALIIWKNFDFEVDFYNHIVSVVYKLADQLYFPLLKKLFQPLIYLYDGFRDLELDLAPISVSCNGAAAPLEILLNLVILGIVIILIESDFQMYRAVSHMSVTNEFLNTVVIGEYRKYFFDSYLKTSQSYTSWCKACLAYTYLCLQVSIAVISAHTDFFQTALLGVVSCVTLNKFVEDKGFHKFSPACNQVHLYVGVDHILAVSASIVAWILLMPAVYTLSKVLVPGVPYSDFDISHLSHKTKLDAAEMLLFQHKAKQREREQEEATGKAQEHRKEQEGQDNVEEEEVDRFDFDLELARSSSVMHDSREIKARSPVDTLRAIDVVLFSWKLKGELTQSDLINVGYDKTLASEVEQLYRRRDLLFTGDLQEHILPTESLDALRESDDSNSAQDAPELTGDERRRDYITNTDDKANVSVLYIKDTYRRFFFRIFKFTSVLTFDLWWASLSKKWLKSIRKNIPSDFKVARPAREILVSMKAIPLEENHNDVREERVCCGVLKRSSYLLAPVLRATDEEEKNYKKWKSTRMPSYIQLCQDEATEMQMKTMTLLGIKDKRCVPWSVCALLTFMGLGHLFTEIGRRYWFIVYLKFSRFLALTLGIWGQNIYDSFDVKGKMEQYSMHYRMRVETGLFDTKTIDTMLDQGIKYDHAEVLYSLVATRAVLLQILPYFSVLAIFASLTARSPLFVISEELKKGLHPLLYSRQECFRIAEQMEVDMIEHVHRYSIEELKEPLSALTKPKKRYWLIYINAINNFFFNSRLMDFLFNFMKYIAALTVILGDIQQSVLVLVVLGAFSLPFATCASMYIVATIGKALRITDEDLVWFLTFGCYYGNDMIEEDGTHNHDTEHNNDNTSKYNSDDVQEESLNPLQQTRSSRVSALYSYYDKEEEQAAPQEDVAIDRLSVTGLDVNDDIGTHRHSRHTTIEMRDMLRSSTLG